jgi:hydroxymethylbilane synthase
VDATLLALAGLKRLNMAEVVRSSQVVGWDEMLPAVAQGAIGIQCRTGDARVLHYLSALNHPATKAAVDCERAFLRCLDGNCRTPIAGQARFVGGRLQFRGLISKPDGKDMIRVTLEGSGDVDTGAAESLGNSAGLEIRRMAGAGFDDYQHAIHTALQAA